MRCIRSFFKKEFLLFSQMDEARALPPFRCEEIEKNQLAKEWKCWKSALEIYFVAYDVTDQRKMRALLLHFGGKQLQCVFDSLPEKDKLPIVATTANWYDVAVSKLDQYFEPGRQYILERCRLRKIKQESGERFSHFVLRIRQHLANCGLEKYGAEVKEVLSEIFMIDVIVEGCASDELQRRILQKDRSLAEIEELGAMMEGVNQQIKDLGMMKTPELQPGKVFQVNSERKYDGKMRGRSPRSDWKSSSSNNDSLTCYSCGTMGHISSSKRCKARNQICRRCKKVGHFEAVCRKRQSPPEATRSKKVRMLSNLPTAQVKQEEKELTEIQGTDQDRKEYYCFYGGNQSNVVQCVVGGVPLKLLVDSGSDINVVHKEAWQYLKDRQIKVSDMQRGCDQVVKGYGSTTPLRIIGTFSAETSIGSNMITAKFFVVEGGQRCLLGDTAAKALNVLKVGVDVNQIEKQMQPFGKIKDVQVRIHMDPMYKPVFQPIRRIPIPYETAVNKKMDFLLAQDIIEVRY